MLCVCFIVPSLEQSHFLNDVKSAYCKGLAPLDKTFALMGILYRNVVFEEDDDLSDLILDEDNPNAEIDI